MVASKYRWAQNNYDVIFRFIFARTNAHILKHLLRSEDGDRYREFLNRKDDIAKNTAVKRERNQELYRTRRETRLDQRVPRMSVEENAGVSFQSEDI